MPKLDTTTWVALAVVFFVLVYFVGELAVPIIVVSGLLYNWFRGDSHTGK